jgi:hypothetical protein
MRGVYSGMIVDTAIMFDFAIVLDELVEKRKI